MPGTIDAQNGYIFQGGALQYNNNSHFAENLATLLNLPVTIENDARCAAQAELWQGKLQNVENALVLVIGTGLGCAIVQSGEVYRGTHLYAGEFSLIFTKRFEEYGFEAVVGNQVGIPHFVAKLSEIYGRELDGEEAFQLIQKGEPKFVQPFEEYAENFATQLFNFQIMFDPEKILIGGGISQNTFYMEKLSETLESFYQKIPIPIRHSPLESCYFRNEANLIGAVKHYLQISDAKI
ncbi:ROK family protein [Enterococcus sp. HY326]|uniref:ROK family protein n=1 Tax=Enterococcus sp. HY326 TaxID=2971265 RepID=UPI0022402DC0|nr:ROK family protein [Enterococcus sp. HY326]